LIAKLVVKTVAAGGKKGSGGEREKGSHLTPALSPKGGELSSTLWVP
jgi:hypothetical protein